MKTTIMLKEFGTLSFVKGIVAGATPPVRPSSQPQRISEIVRHFEVRQTKRAETLREMLRRRETTPFASAIPCHRWGLNE